MSTVNIYPQRTAVTVVNGARTQINIRSPGVQGPPGDTTAATAAAAAAAASAAAAAASAAEAAAAVIPEPPDDGAVYGRVNGAWVKLVEALKLTGTLPDWTAGQAYSAALTIAGGQPPYVLDSITVPAGFDAVIAGDQVEVTGTSSVVGDFEWSFDVSDAIGLDASLTQPGAGGAGAPFDGVFLDTSVGDLFTDRLSYTPAATLTVDPTLLSFSSASAVAIDLQAKEDDGNVMRHCFDYFDVDIAFTTTSFPAADAIGFFGGWITSVLGSYFAGEVKAHPASAALAFRRLRANSAIRVSGGVSVAFTPGAAGRLLLRRQGTLLETTITFNSGALSETLQRTLTFTVGSDELPRLFAIPFIRFVSGVHTVTGLKLSASFPNADFAFMGDSLTQGRFATAYADGFPQLIRGDHPDQVIVCGAPSATTGDWLNATRSLIRMKPRRVFVALGVNDLASAVPDATTKANFTTINSRLAAAGITPVYLTVPPFNNANTPALNSWLKAQGWRYIDIYPLLEGSPNVLNAAYNSGDNLHWNTAGHLIVADAVRAYITAQGW